MQRYITYYLPLSESYKWNITCAVSPKHDLPTSVPFLCVC